VELRGVYVRAGEVRMAEGPRHAQALTELGFIRAADLTEAQLPLFRLGYRVGWREAGDAEECVRADAPLRTSA